MPGAADGALGAQPAGAPTPLLDRLPQPLLSQVLRHLPPGDLASCGTASRAMRAATSADELWLPHWPLGAPRPQPGASVRAAYSRLRRSQCADCSAPTRHVFVLLNSRRVCSACEQARPLVYGLATELEAQDRYGLSLAALESLPSITALRRRWFLRSAVAAAAEAAHGRRGTGGGGGSESGDGSGSDGEAGSEVQREDAPRREEGEEHEEEEKEQGNGAGPPAGSGASGAATGSGSEEDARLAARLQAMEVQAAQREARRAERKQHKKQAKAEKRAMREMKSQGIQPAERGGGGAGAGSAHVDVESPRHPGGNATGSAGPSSSFGRHRDRKRARFLEQRQQRGKATTGTARHGRAGCGRSAWLAEREALFQEYGSFDVSGLALAED